MRSACDSGRPTTVTHGQSWSLDGCRHDSAKSAFALFRALETSPRLVVRDRIELSTFRFSVLRMIVHSRPSRFICLIQNLRRPLAYFPARTRMRQELRPRASPWPPMPGLRAAPQDPACRACNPGHGRPHRLRPPAGGRRRARRRPSPRGREYVSAGYAALAVSPIAPMKPTARGARRLWARPVLPKTRPDQRRAAGRRGGVPGCPRGDARGQLPTAGGRVVGPGIWRPSGPLSAPGGSRTRRCTITACASGPRCGRRRRASPRGCWTTCRGGRAHPLHRRRAPLGHGRLRGAAAARAPPHRRGGAGAGLPERGRAGPGLCAQRRAVAGRGGPVTSPTAMSLGQAPA